MYVRETDWKSKRMPPPYAEDDADGAKDVEETASDTNSVGENIGKEPSVKQVCV